MGCGASTHPAFRPADISQAGEEANSLVVPKAMGCGAGTHQPVAKGSTAQGGQRGTPGCGQDPLSMRLQEVRKRSPQIRCQSPAELCNSTSSLFFSSKMSNLSTKQQLFKALGANKSGTVAAPQIKPEALTAEARRLLFEILDWNNSDHLDAEELMRVLLRLGLSSFSEEDVITSIREIDTDGDGNVCANDFSALLETPPAPDETKQPHLVLHFDINQTVLMADTQTRADASLLLNCVLANSCWGHIVEVPEKKSPDASHEPGEVPPWQRWELASEVPSVIAPGPDLYTYCQFLSQWIPAGKARRALLRAFTAPGSPGERMAGQITRLLQDLRLPEGIVEATDAAILEELGLQGGNRLLLQSFLEMLRGLKLAGRSFSICFRTFGSDLGKIAGEFNALCENRHPLFAEEDVVLDGSDGAPDMRLKVEPGARSCGTWVRQGNDISLVFGTIEQPPLEKAKAEALSEFYAQVGADDAADASAKGDQVCIASGSSAVRDELRSILHRPGAGCTLALRDYYDGWSATGCHSEGGKPLFLEHRDTDVLQIFFDDHVLPNDLHIIDCRLAEEPGQPVPIARVFGVHVVRAEPLYAIRDPRYFLDAVAAAETQWRSSCRRRRELAEAMANYASQAAFAAANHLDHSSTFTRSMYTPHSQCDFVKLRSDANALDDDDDLQVARGFSHAVVGPSAFMEKLKRRSAA